MDALDSRTRPDIIVALAWALATFWLKLRARLALLLRQMAPAPCRAREPGIVVTDAQAVTRLERIAERAVWRSETVALLQYGAAIALAEAEVDCARARAEVCELIGLAPVAPPAQERGEPPLAA